MNINSFIALRYIFSKRRIGLITIISFLSFGGITIGTAALIIVLAVFNGFGGLVKQMLINFDPHVRIEAVDAKGAVLLDSLQKQFDADDKILSYSHFATGKVLANGAGGTRIIEVKGIELEKQATYGVYKSIVLGKYNLETDSSGYPGAVIGLTLADRLSTLVGDTLTLISPANLESVIAGIAAPKTQTYIVRGIFASNNNDFDASLVFTPLEYTAPLLGYTGGRSQGVEIRLKSLDESEGFAERIRTQGNESLAVFTWYDLHKNLYSVMEIERYSAYLLLSLIIAVAVFNILASLTMSVVEKKRDIGILRTMGLEQADIVKLFMKEGLFIGVLGTVFGFALALLIYYLHITFNLYPLDPFLYRINSLPLELKLFDFIIVGVASITLSFLAALYPALRAAKTNELEAIRWE